MTSSWLFDRLNRISTLEGYVKPQKINDDDALKLDSNENLALNKNFISKIALQAAKRIDLREYPQGEFEMQLYMQLAKYLGINKTYLAVGSGSVQIIELILSTIGRDLRVTVFTPTFSYFISRCGLHRLIVDSIALNKEDNTINQANFLKSAKKSHIVYICSPNNPTGNQFCKQSILNIIDKLEDKLILIDEAYVEFADYSLASDIISYDNIIVLRTLSKAFGLAGARVGYLVTNQRFAEIFRTTIQSPYPLNSLSLIIASIMLSYSDYVKKTVELVKKERKKVFDRLHKINGIKAFKSDANFIFIESYDKYQAILEELKDEKLIVKALGDVDGHKGCIRVTIGTKEMNDKFLKSVERVVA